jgi:hypothetical protein
MSLISTTNKLYLTDPVVKSILESVQIEVNDVLNSATTLERQYWIDTADTSIRDWEQHFAVRIVSSVLEDRRNAVTAKMRSAGDVDIELIKRIADSWKNGEVNVGYEDMELKISFKSTIGVPSDLTTLISAVEEVASAHVIVSYTLNYLLIKHIHGVMTLRELEQQPLSKFAF